MSCPRTERVEPQTLPARSSDTQAIHADTALGKPQAVIDEEHKATLGCTENCCGHTGRPSCQIRHFVDLPPTFAVFHQHLKIKR